MQHMLDAGETVLVEPEQLRQGRMGSTVAKTAINTEPVVRQKSSDGGFEPKAGSRIHYISNTSGQWSDTSGSVTTSKLWTLTRALTSM